jgi:hypothetical protein
MPLASFPLQKLGDEKARSPINCNLRGSRVQRSQSGASGEIEAAHRSPAFTLAGCGLRTRPCEASPMTGARPAVESLP